MFQDDVAAICRAGEKKLEFMMRSPAGYFLISALAGVYLGFGITLIFSLGGPLAAGGGAAVLKLVMGMSFGIALSLVVFAGSELFTGNNMVFAVASLNGTSRRGPVLASFVLCFLGNLAGSFFLAFLVVQSGCLSPESRELLLKVAAAKMALAPKEAFLRGILCNWLVCLAIWVGFRMQNESAKLIMIFWCLFAFIASGFEHSIANQALLGMALILPHGPDISLGGFVHNQVYVTLGNMVGGGGLVGTLYWLAGRPAPLSTSDEPEAGFQPAALQES
ncbi:MAG: nitrite transporter NirC [Nitrospinae bacterium CG11_big_fil_rev_8_21_14_0_20_56_8]|nr:MAG: nitrite transporter NirC [Nitrospinae bacterium CG11_big_fil_rev_8_21_14_0_20_56_8]